MSTSPPLHFTSLQVATPIVTTIYIVALQFYSTTSTRSSALSFNTQISNQTHQVCSELDRRTTPHDISSLLLQNIGHNRTFVCVGSKFLLSGLAQPDGHRLKSFPYRLPPCVVPSSRGGACKFLFFGCAMVTHSSTNRSIRGLCHLSERGASKRHGSGPRPRGRESWKAGTFLRLLAPLLGQNIIRDASCN